MGIKEEIKDFTDGNKLVSPDLVPPSILSASDNGPMFTAEYFVMLQKLGLLTDADKKDYSDRIEACINPQGILCRVPVGQSDGQEGPDDYYGVLNGCKTLGNTEIPRKFLLAVIKYMGFLNNDNPGVRTGDSFLIRQGQMLAAMVAAAFPSYFNPFHWLVRILAFPFFLWASITIFISCINTPAGETDPRRLSWHLIQTVCPVSLLCRLASVFWYRRLYEVYGDQGMKAVARIYYNPKGVHPFSKYWVD